MSHYVTENILAQREVLGAPPWVERMLRDYAAGKFQHVRVYEALAEPNPTQATPLD